MSRCCANKDRRRRLSSQILQTAYSVDRHLVDSDLTAYENSHLFSTTSPRKNDSEQNIFLFPSRHNLLPSVSVPPSFFDRHHIGDELSVSLLTEQNNRGREQRTVKTDSHLPTYDSVLGRLGTNVT